MLGKSLWGAPPWFKAIISIQTLQIQIYTSFTQYYTVLFWMEIPYNFHWCSNTYFQLVKSPQ